jgi:hypothetical protein
VHNSHKQCTKRPLAEVKEVVFKSEKTQAFLIDIEKNY